MKIKISCLPLSSFSVSGFWRWLWALNYVNIKSSSKKYIYFSSILISELQITKKNHIQISVFFSVHFSIHLLLCTGSSISLFGPYLKSFLNSSHDFLFCCWRSLGVRGELNSTFFRLFWENPSWEKQGDERSPWWWQMGWMGTELGTCAWSLTAAVEGHSVLASASVGCGRRKQV